MAIMEEKEELIAGQAEEKAPEAVTEAEPPRKRRGRKPRTEEQKRAAAEAREERKRKAENLVPLVYVQYQESEAEIGELIEAAKAEFRKEKKRTKITDMKLYVKPEERTAYYVINEKADGKISY